MLPRAHPQPCAPNGLGHTGPPRTLRIRRHESRSWSGDAQGGFPHTQRCPATPVGVPPDAVWGRSDAPHDHSGHAGAVPSSSRTEHPGVCLPPRTLPTHIAISKTHNVTAVHTQSPPHTQTTQNTNSSPPLPGQQAHPAFQAQRGEQFLDVLVHSAVGGHMMLPSVMRAGSPDRTSGSRMHRRRRKTVTAHRREIEDGPVVSVPGGSSHRDTQPMLPGPAPSGRTRRAQ